MGEVAVACIYYRPKPEDFSRMLGSLVEQGIRFGVFVDGPYEGVSRDIKTVRSEREDIDNYRAICEVQGGGVVDTESRVWETEAEKRSFAALLAYRLFGDVCSHLLILDSDEELITPVPIPEPGRLGVARIIDPNKPRGGATMIRLHELTDSLRWGPAHFEVANRGVRYATPHCLPDLAHSFTIRHHGLPVKADADYQRYNDHERMRREAAGRGREGDYAYPSWPYQSRESSVYISIAPPVPKEG